jgi:CheY-like chemotaxis protein
MEEIETMDEAQRLHTEFAPSERASAEEIERQARYFADHAHLQRLLDAMPNIVLILNKERQIVYANAATFGLPGIEEKTILGLRPGEMVNCIRPPDSAGGCGTTKFCSTCGAVRAILAAQRADQSSGACVEECRITQRLNGDMDALDLRVWATPFEFSNEAFTIFAVADISDEKRREALDRIFFHDVLNTAGAMRGVVELLREVPDDAELFEIIHSSANRLIDEIQAQRQLAAAENHELSVEPVEVSSVKLLHQIASIYANLDWTEARHICISESAEDIVLMTDATLLGRVLENLAKNALEASPPGQTVTLGCRGIGEEIEFWVHNTASMPVDVELQVFQRSFSTKGPGRGLGTYSVKLLSERYLQGEVSFTTSEEEGTTFRARYPLRLATLDSQPGPMARDSVSESQRNLHILLAEDNKINQKLAVAMLEKWGHTVVVASNGKEALAALEEQGFDLVLMDVQMPEMDGFEATAAIRGGEKATGRHIPIVAMTAHAMEGDRERCLEAGMDGYTSKPIRAKELSEAIESLFPFVQEVNE